VKRRGESERAAKTDHLDPIDIDIDIDHDPCPDSIKSSFYFKC
jgi:hypothetical protein